jgi:flagellar protein FliL
MTDRAFDDDAAASADGKAPSAASGGGKKKLILIAAPIVLLLLVGGGLFATGMLGKLFGGGEQAEEAGHSGGHAGHGDAKGKGDEHAKQVVFHDLPDILVNLNSTGKKTSFLKMSVALELDDPADVPRVQAVLPRIIDNFQVYLRELRVEDLRGSAGLYRLREELLTRVNAAAAPAKVVDILFKEMLVQ